MRGVRRDFVAYGGGGEQGAIAGEGEGASGDIESSRVGKTDTDGFAGGYVVGTGGGAGEGQVGALVLLRDIRGEKWTNFIVIY